jgi:hypothetical protein
LIELYQRLRGRKGNVTRASIVLKAKGKSRAPEDVHDGRTGGDDTNDEVAIISGSWLEEWLHFMAGTTCHQPRALDNAELRCDKHGMLIVAPHLQDISGMSCLGDLQASADSGSGSSSYPDVELVTSRQWQALARRYGSEDTQRLFEVLSTGAEGSRQWSVCPCAECIDQFAKDDEAARRSFQDERFEVSTIRAETVMLGLDGVSTAIAVGSAAAPPSRRSARSTRGRSKDRLSVTLSSDDQVNVVKLKIFQEMDDFEVSPVQIVLFCGERELDGHHRTLSDCGVLRGQRLQVKIDQSRVSTGEPIDEAFAGWLAGDGSRRAETGFQGTLLGSAAGFSSHRGTGAVTATSSSVIDIATEDASIIQKLDEEAIKQVMEVTDKPYDAAERVLRENGGNVSHAIAKLIEE